jgi:hypothetical protein
MNEDVLAEQLRYSSFAKYLVDKSFGPVLEQRNMASAQNARAKAFLVEEVTHILEQMAFKETGMIDRIVDQGDEQYFRKIVDFVATKLRKRGYNDKFYHDMLPENEKQTEGHVDMVRNCEFDLESIRSRCTFSEDAPKNIEAIVRRAVIAAYEIIDPGYDHGLKNTIES